MKCAIATLLLCVGLSISHDSLAAEWVAHSGDSIFKNDTYSLRVAPTGDILDLQFDEVRVFDQARIFGRTRDEQNRQIRLRAVDKGAVSNVNKDDNLTRIKVNGNISAETGSELEDCAEFEEEIICHTEQIEFIYKVTALKEITFVSWAPFCVVASAPVEPFAGKALETINSSGALAVLEVKREYEKIQYQTNNLSSFSFVLDNGKIDYDVGNGQDKKLRMSICDGREWKGENLEIAVIPILPATRRSDGLVKYPPGTEFKWSFSIQFTRF